MPMMHEPFSISQARDIDLVDYLSGLGHEPVRIRNANFWYLSPLREESVPSFKVNRKINRWFDYGLGKGGSLIDFAILYNHCTIRELMRSFNQEFPFRQPPVHRPEQYRHVKQSRLHILEEKPLADMGLLRYLRQRGIPIVVADTYCREVSYEVGAAVHVGIGFKNDSGGFEIRSRYFKGGNSPKDITTVKNRSPEVAVFEGFMDFLSFKVVGEPALGFVPDYVVLNSVVFFDRARPFMESHARVHLYLDHDKAGDDCVARALALEAHYQDARTLYEGYKDLNEWVMRFSRPGPGKQA